MFYTARLRFFRVIYLMCLGNSMIASVVAIVIVLTMVAVVVCSLALLAALPGVAILLWLSLLTGISGMGQVMVVTLGGIASLLIAGAICGKMFRPQPALVTVR